MKKYLPILMVTVLAVLALLASCNNNKNGYTIKFNTEGGTPVPNSQLVEAGGKAVPPDADPVRKGYIFVCWHLKGTSSAYNFETPINQDITLYARWLRIPSDVFSVMDDEYFIEYCKVFDSNGDGILSPEEAASVTEMKSLYGIKSLMGIEYFTSLTYLDCSSSWIQNLDLSANKMLTELRCNGNELMTLDISSNTKLERLECNGNKLEDLDVSSNKALKYLKCSLNKIENLDISTHKDLTSLECIGNKLTKIEIGASMNLTELICNHNQLTTLDISNNLNLEYLLCDQNPDLKEITVWGGFNIDNPSNSIPVINKDADALFVTKQ